MNSYFFLCFFFLVKVHLRAHVYNFLEWSSLFTHFKIKKVSIWVDGGLCNGTRQNN